MWLVDNSSECCLSQSGRFIIVGDPIQCRINFKKGFPHNVSHSFVVMEIPKEDYPDWFKEGHFDALLVHCAKDTESAHCFKDFIRRIIDPFEDPQYPKICLLNPSHGFSEDLRRVDRLVDKSTYVFFVNHWQFSWRPFLSDDARWINHDNHMQWWRTLESDTGVSNKPCKQNSTGHQGDKCHIIIKNHIYGKYDINTPHFDPR